eukprot:1167847-Rhodomonas_salina.1
MLRPLILGVVSPEHLLDSIGKASPTRMPTAPLHWHLGLLVGATCVACQCTFTSKHVNTPSTSAALSTVDCRLPVSPELHPACGN